MSPAQVVTGRGPWLAALLVLAGVTAGCMRARQVVYLDDEWNSTYARNSCYLYLPKADRDPGLDDCLTRQDAALRAFVQSLRSQLRAQPACAAVSMANPVAVQAPPPGRGFWRLLVSLGDLQGRREKWDLMRPENGGIVHGAGDAAAIARDICLIASGHDNKGGG